MHKKYQVLTIVASVLLGGLSAVAADVHVDLSGQFDRDAFVTGGVGLGDPLDEDGNYLDAATLPGDYVDGVPYGTVDGFTTFLYGQLMGDALDSLRVSSQDIAVPAGSYQQLHMALLSDVYLMDLSQALTLNYADGTSEEIQFGPLADMTGTPARFFDSRFVWVDDSDVTELVSIRTKENDEEYIVEATGSAASGPFDFHFVDATSVLEYEFDLPDDLADATVGIDMQNNFVVNITTDFGGTYTEVLNSFEMFGEDIHSGSNRGVFEVDLTPFLAQADGNVIGIRFTDGSEVDGWGPAIWTVNIFSGQTITYDDEPLTEIDASNATIFADFRTDGGAAEAEYLIDDQSVAPTGANHRFADGGGFVVYGFDLPDDVTDAQASINMEADFVLSVATQRDLTTHIDFVAGGEDAEYIFEDNGSVGRPTDRFVDAGGILVYLFDLADDLTEARLEIDMQNNFLVSVDKNEFAANGVLNSMDMFGEDVHNGSNRGVYTVDLTEYLADNPLNEIFVVFEDGSTADGWGPDIMRIAIKSGVEGEYVETLSARDISAGTVAPYAAQSGNNKAYYTVDLAPFLENNAGNNIFLRFTDATTTDGWGPGLFRVIVHSGEIVPQIDNLAMPGIVPTGGLPDNSYPWGTNLMRRGFPVNPDKSLSSITLPELRDDWDVFLLAATLEGESTPVSDWSIY